MADSISDRREARPGKRRDESSLARLIAHYTRELLCVEDFGPVTWSSWMTLMSRLCPLWRRSGGECEVLGDDDFRGVQAESIARFEADWRQADIASSAREVEVRMEQAFRLRREDARLLALGVAVSECAELRGIVLSGGQNALLRRIALISGLPLGVVVAAIGNGSTLLRASLLRLDADSPGLWVDPAAVLVAEAASLAEIRDYFAPLAEADGFIPDQAAVEGFDPASADAIRAIMCRYIPGNHLIVAGEGVARGLSALLALSDDVGRPLRLARRPFRELGETSPTLFGVAAATAADSGSALVIEGLPREMGPRAEISEMDAERSAYIGAPPCPVFWLVSDQSRLPRGAERFFSYSAILRQEKPELGKEFALLGSMADPGTRDIAIELLRGRESLRGRETNLEERKPIRYDASSLRTEPRLEGVVEALSGRVRGAAPKGLGLLFWGPPGTGKTAFAAHLAARVGTGLAACTASDFLRSLVGEGEREVREAFARAESRGDILLIDEADSVLRKRSEARNSWDISLTNEILARMDCYRGVVIACTNRLSDLDPAVLRRFAWKVEFKPLDPAGAERLFRLYFPQGAEPRVISALSRLNDLVPGDFEAVRRKFEFAKNAPDGQAVVAQLAAELKYRGGQERRVGFA